MAIGSDTHYRVDWPQRCTALHCLNCSKEHSMAIFTNIHRQHNTHDFQLHYVIVMPTPKHKVRPELLSRYKPG